MRNVSEIAMALDVVTRIYCTRSPGGGMITWKSEAATLSFRDSLVRTPLDILCFFIRAVNGSGVTSFARSTGDDFCSGRNRRGAAPRRAVPRQSVDASRSRRFFQLVELFISAGRPCLCNRTESKVPFDPIFRTIRCARYEAEREKIIGRGDTRLSNYDAW